MGGPACRPCPHGSLPDHAAAAPCLAEVLLLPVLVLVPVPVLDSALVVLPVPVMLLLMLVMLLPVMLVMLQPAWIGGAAV